MAVTPDFVIWEPAPDGFTGLASAVLALPAMHWERFGAHFVAHSDDPDWPERLAAGSAALPGGGRQAFGLLDEGDVTTLLIPGDQAERTGRATRVINLMGYLGYLDTSRDILETAIGDLTSDASQPGSGVRLKAEREGLVQQITDMTNQFAEQIRALGAGDTALVSPDWGRVTAIHSGELEGLTPGGRFIFIESKDWPIGRTVRDLVEGEKVSYLPPKFNAGDVINLQVVAVGPDGVVEVRIPDAGPAPVTVEKRDREK